MSNYILGKKSIMDAINNRVKIISIKASKRHFDFLKTLDGISYEIVSKNFFNKYQGNHQEIIAFIEQQQISYTLDEIINLSNDNIQFTILIVDSIESPHNFGAILRTCAALNVDVVIYKNNNQVQINDVVIKTSLGALNYLKMCNVSNLNYVIDKLKNNGFWIYGSSLNDRSKDINSIDFADKSVILVGNENKGISKLTLDKCDYLFKIDMNDKIQSLNVSVATGIILYHRFKTLK